MERMKASELNLGDTVRLFDGAFGDAVVQQITDEGVTFFRPYATTADFSYTGGAIPYIGIETRHTVSLETFVNVLRRAEPKR